MTANRERLTKTCFAGVLSGVLICVIGLTGCGIINPVLDQFLAVSKLDHSNTDLEMAIAIVSPAALVTAAPGAPTIIQWADIAKIPGTVIRVSAQRQDALQANIGDPIQLVGDGSAGSGRDAIGDGQNDIFEWDITGVRVGDYVITVTIESPTGESLSAVSRDTDRGTNGVIRVTTALPVPTLTFTNPGATDVTATPPTAVLITWTDNGSNNADALLTLGLDLDDDHDNGNEILLLTNQPLSTDGNNGSFSFNYLDEQGNTVDPETYQVFARIDDNANDIVTVTATGRLVVNP